MLNKLSKKKPKRFLFVIVSDTHAGHRLGLLNPETTFIEYDENGEVYDEPVSLTKSQEYLWKLYSSHIEAVKKLANGDPIILLHNGDLTIGVKYPRQMSFTAISNQIISAYMNLEPWFKVPNLRAVRLTYGTQSHELFEGTAPRLVVSKLKDKHPDSDIQMIKHGLSEIEGSSFEYAHHGPYTGSRKWLEGNVALYHLKDRMFSELLAHKTPPKYYIYSHYHTPVEVYCSIRQNGAFARSWLFVTPSYQLMGDYAHQATRSRGYVTNGCLVLECLGDRLVGDPIWLTETSDIRTKEVIKL